MSQSFMRLTGALAILTMVASLAIAQGGPSYSNLPNFKQINERLYRGGQPQSGGFRRLAGLGIDTVINLRAADERAHADLVRATAAGLRYFNVPMPIHNRPTNEQIERVLAIINSPENGSVFIYCRRGADRTGTVVAIYRISNDGWTSGMAQAEANRHGMFFTQLEMKDYIKDYYCSGASADCDDPGKMEEFGIAAAKAMRVMAEEVGSHSLTRNSFRQLQRFLR